MRIKIILCSFICPSSEDNRVLLWDVRSSKGSLMSLDQFNGQEVPTFLSGKIFKNYYFTPCIQFLSWLSIFMVFFGGGGLGCNEVDSFPVRKKTTIIIPHYGFYKRKKILWCTIKHIGILKQIQHIYLYTLNFNSIILLGIHFEFKYKGIATKKKLYYETCTHLLMIDWQLVIQRTIFVNNYFFWTILACTAHSGNVNGMSFTMDGLHLVTSGTDNRIRLWNIETGRNTLVNYGKIQNETRKGLQFAVSCWCKSDLIYIPDEYCNIQVYEMFTGRKIDTLRGHLQQVNCCVFHPDYQELYSGGNDRNVLIWEPELDGSYDNYLKERSSKKQTQSRSFVTRIAATADSWSSDEET